MPAKKKTAKPAIISKEMAKRLSDAFLVIGGVWVETGVEAGDAALEFLAEQTFDIAICAGWIPADVYRLHEHVPDPALLRRLIELEPGDVLTIPNRPTKTETETLINIWMVQNEFAEAFNESIAESKEFIRESCSVIKQPSEWEEPNPGQIMKRFRKASGMTNVLIAKRSHVSLKTLERLIDGRSKALRYKNAVTLCEFMRTVMKVREDRDPADAKYFLAIDLMDIRWRRKQS